MKVLPLRKSEPESAPLTEATAAECFTATHGALLRYDHRRRIWRQWDTRIWQQDSDRSVVRLALAFVRAEQQKVLQSHLDRADRDRALGFWLKMDRGSMLQSLLDLAKDLKPIADAGDGWDAKPYLLPVTNGVVDLKTGRLIAGRQEDRLTMAAPVSFQPMAKAPRWERFIDEVFNGHSELIRFIHKAIGYCLTGDISEQVLFFAHGTGSNGKGTFLNTLRRVFGDYGHALPFSALEHDPRPGAASNELAALLGKRFVVASETSEGRRLDEGRIKWLTGGDPIRARFLYSESFEFMPASKFWIAANHRPIVRDDSHGFWRRMRLIPFTQQFTVDPTLADTLAAEAAGILAWAVRGCLLWQHEGLIPPSIVTDATEEYRKECDTFGQFTEQAIDIEGTSQVSGKDLFDHYIAWTTANGMTGRSEQLTATAFGRKASERFDKAKVGGKVVYFGIRRRAL